MLNLFDRRLLITAFFLTGATGLVFQIIWTRLLVLSFGFTTYSVSTVVATFMAGLALGSFFGGKLADHHKQPVLLYAFAEIIVGIFALIATFLFLQFPELVAQVRTELGIPYHGFSGWVVLASLCILLPPTILMGATLPLLARVVTKSQNSGGTDISPLYAFNTLGAATGSLLTGFVALALLGVITTASLAALVNILIGLVIVQRFRQHERVLTKHVDTDEMHPAQRSLVNPITIVFAISGFTSLMAEVAWTRILAPFLESSVYAYSLVISLFLLGIAAGTLVAKRYAHAQANAARSFAWAQIAIGACTLLGLVLLYPFIGLQADILRDLGAIVKDPAILLSHSAWFALILLPSTFFMGAGFPFVALWVSQQYAQLGQRTGGVYAMNTVAAVIGSIAAGFYFIPQWGVKNTLVFAALLSLLFGGWLLLRETLQAQKRRVSIMLGLFIVGISFFGWQMREPGYFATQMGYPDMQVIWHQEGIDTAVTLLGQKHQVKSLNIGLRPVSGTSRRLTPWMTHLPILLGTEHTKQIRVLNIGLGVGHTFDVAHAYPSAEVTVVELVPKVYEAFKLYRTNAQALLASERAKVVLGDGRNYLLNQPDNSLDVIIVDPTPPLYGAGAVNLYTQEFFAIAARKLAGKGRLMMRLPYSADADSIRMVLHTALTRFAHVSLWKPNKGSGYSMIASPQDLDLPDEKTLATRIAGLNHLDQEELAYQLLMQPRLVAKNAQLLSFVLKSPVVTDDQPYLEHPLYFFRWR